MHAAGAAHPEEGEAAVYTYFPANEFLDAANMVMEFSYQIETMSPHGQLGVFVRMPAFTLTVNPEHSEVGAWGEYSGQEWNENILVDYQKERTEGVLKVVVYQDTVLFFLDDRLLAVFQDQPPYGTRNGLAIDGAGISAAIDDFKFWNLDGIEFRE